MVLHGESVQLPASDPLWVTLRTAAVEAAGSNSRRARAAASAAKRSFGRDGREPDKGFTFRSTRNAGRPFLPIARSRSRISLERGVRLPADPTRSPSRQLYHGSGRVASERPGADARTDHLAPDHHRVRLALLAPAIRAHADRPRMPRRVGDDLHPEDALRQPTDAELGHPVTLHRLHALAVDVRHHPG